MWIYRFVVGILVAAIAAVSVVPLLVLLDLAGGGDGWGICPDGLTSCATSYFQGPELAFALLLVLFALLGVLRFVVVVHRWWSTRRRRISAQG